MILIASLIYTCLSARPCTPYASPIMSAHCALSFGCCSEHHFEASPFQWVRPTTPFQLKTARIQQRLKPYASSYRTQEAPGRRQRLGPYAYRYRTQEAQLKPDCCTEGRRIGSRTTSAYSFLYYFFILYMYLSINIISLLSVYSHLSHLPSLLLLIFQIHKLLHG